MKTFKHKTNGTIATYKDGVFKQGNICLEIGCEPSSEFWEEALFTTKDNVNIFEGCVIYGVTNDWKVFSHYTDLKNKIKHWGKSPIFSTKEKAEEYILENTPCLSLRDLYDFNTQFADKIDILVDARNLVKKKLKNGR